MLRPYHSISECFKARCWDEPPKKEKSENTVASHTDKNHPHTQPMTRFCPVSLSTRTQNSLALAGSQFSSMLAVKFAQTHLPCSSCSEKMWGLQSHPSGTPFSALLWDSSSAKESLCLCLSEVRGLRGKQITCIVSIRASAVIPSHEQLEEEQNLGLDAIKAADKIQTHMQGMHTFRSGTSSVRE